MKLTRDTSKGQQGAFIQTVAPALGPKEDEEGRILLPLSLGYKLVTTPLSCCHVIFLCLYKNAFSSSPALRQRRRNPILDKIDCSSNLQKRETLVFSQFQRRRPGGLTRRCTCRPLGFITPPRKDNGSLRVRVAIPSYVIALLLSV